MRYPLARPALLFIGFTLVAGTANAQPQGPSPAFGSTGCINQYMTNNVWSMRVLSVAPSARDSSPRGWVVTQEWRNATSRPVLAGSTADDSRNASMTNVSGETLTTQSGAMVSTSDVTGGFSLSARGAPFAVGAPYTFKQLFTFDKFNESDKPVQLVVAFDAARQNALQGRPHYRTPANFMIKLDCKKQ